MIIVAGAVVFGHFLAVTRIPFALAGWVGGPALPVWIVMGLIVVFSLIAGCFVDAPRSRENPAPTSSVYSLS